MVRNPPATAGRLRDTGSTPVSGRSLREGHGNPLQYSSLENPMDRGVWQATVHGSQEADNLVTKNQQHALNFIDQEFRQSTANMVHSCSIKTDASVRVAKMAEDC